MFNFIKTFCLEGKMLHQPKPFRWYHRFLTAIQNFLDTLDVFRQLRMLVVGLPRNLQHISECVITERFYSCTQVRIIPSLRLCVTTPNMLSISHNYIFFMKLTLSSGSTNEIPAPGVVLHL